MLETQSLTNTGAASATVPVAPRSGTALGKDDFLRLLITQLRHQDPLNPLDQNEFLSQSAQFTALEELQNIGAALDDIRAASTGSSLVDAAALLGRTARAAGGGVQYDGSKPVALAFTVAAPTARVEVEIVDAAGQPLRRLSRAPVEPGPQVIEWDGRDESGRPLAAGPYFYRVSVPGAGGDPATLPVVASGPLTALERRDTRILFRVGDTLVRPEDIVTLG